MRRLVRRLAVTVLFVTLTPLSAQAATEESTQVVAGVRIYLGVLPAEMIRGHPMRHGGVPAPDPAHPGLHQDHLVVALFDENNGARITDAEITANVADVASGQVSLTKVLEPMKIADTQTYGNFFELPDRHDYRIRLEIRRRGREEPVRAEFRHSHIKG